MLKLSIKNFQSIKSFKYQFGSGFYTISGKSNIGKSAIRRAITALLENNLNKEFIRNGTTKCEIEVNGIKRVRSNKENKYTISGKEYDKVGNQLFEYLPDNMKPFEYDGDTENLLTIPQYKPFFLIHENKATQTKILKAIFGVDIIAEVIKDMKRDRLSNTKKINELDVTIKDTESVIKEKQKLYDKYEKIVDIQSKLEYFQELADTKNQYELIVNKIRITRQILTKVNKLLLFTQFDVYSKQQKDLEKQITSISYILTKIRVILNKDDKIHSLTMFVKLNKELEEIQEEIEKLQTKTAEYKILLNKTEKVSFKLETMGSYINSLNKFEKQRKYTRELRRAIEKVIALLRLKAYQLLGSNIVNLSKEINDIKDNLLDVDNQFKQSKICPCCGQVIRKESHNE